MDSYYNNTNNFIGGGVEEDINKYEKYFLFTGIYTALSILIIIICMSIYESNKDITVQNGIFGFMIFYTVSILIGSYWMGYKNKLITTVSNKLKTEFDVDLDTVGKDFKSNLGHYFNKSKEQLSKNVSKKESDSINAQIELVKLQLELANKGKKIDQPETLSSQSSNPAGMFGFKSKYEEEKEE